MVANGFLDFVQDTLIELDYPVAPGTDDVVMVTVIHKDVMGSGRSLVHRPNQPQVT
jgi:hypothetical protein